MSCASWLVLDKTVVVSLWLTVKYYQVAMTVFLCSGLISDHTERNLLRSSHMMTFATVLLHTSIRVITLCFQWNQILYVRLLSNRQLPFMCCVIFILSLFPKETGRASLFYQLCWCERGRLASWSAVCKPDAFHSVTALVNQLQRV